MKRAVDQTQNVDPGARTLTDLIYARLKADIIWSRLSADAPLRSDWLRATYDVGVSPLREALSRLSSEGLVISSGQRGFRVAPLTPTAVRDTAEARVLIEGEALRRSIARDDLEWGAEIAAATHSLCRSLRRGKMSPESEEWAKQHRRYHFALIGGCDSTWLLTMAASLFAHAERHRMMGEYRRIAIETAGVANARNRVAEHEELARTVLAGDADAAVRFLERHYLVSAEAVVKAIEAAGEAVTEFVPSIAERAEPKRRRA